MKVHELITYLQHLSLEAEAVISVADKQFEIEDIKPKKGKILLQGPTYRGNNNQMKFIDGLKIVLENKYKRR